MRTLILTAVTVLALTAIHIASTGSACAHIAHTAGATMNRAHSILVASRAKNILV